MKKLFIFCLLISFTALAKEYSLVEAKMAFHRETKREFPFAEMSGPSELLCQSVEAAQNPKCGLSEAELESIHRYSRSGYEPINDFLRLRWYPTWESLSDIHYINSGLQKLANFKGLTKRVIQTNDAGAAKIRARFIPGSTVRFAAFTSLSTSVMGYRKSGVQLYVYSKTCKYIAPLSHYPYEEEVLCPPGTAFKVIGLRNNFYLLEELEEMPSWGEIR